MAGAAAEGGAGRAIAPQYSSRGGVAPPNKIGAMTMECVLLLHALDAFQNALYTTTRTYIHACRLQLYSSSSPSLYCKLRNACTYVLASRSHAFLGEGMAHKAICGIDNLAPPNSELLPPPPMNGENTGCMNFISNISRDLL